MTRQVQGEILLIICFSYIVYGLKTAVHRGLVLKQYQSFSKVDPAAAAACVHFLNMYFQAPANLSLKGGVSANFAMT